MAGVVRRAVPEDLDAVLAVFADVAAEGLWLGRESPLELSEERLAGWRANLAGDAAGVVFVGEAEAPSPDAGDVVGWIELHPDTQAHVDFGICIREEFRGSGLGGRLLDAGVAWARESGAAKVVCQVWPHNTGAIGLYLSRGFVVEGRLRRHWVRRSGELWDSVLMALGLDTASPGSAHPDSPLLAGTPGALPADEPTRRS